ncbi:response regulator transcription factor [Maribacter polysiphoniae]|uniref:LytTR family two component transcriptional regulator n=1 Tax=Maribacter polysiphoniae TaxID=429344 RepID=A0A316E0T7_9FLAO|nr:LytTR family DNA-binding domain-containing protein [Maribacter polysiphoniae]MBD1261054.1 response regulator transcription factor [Maribacter polysiphoniae]PWK23705.1 LytTR family two component transcriptional regulator [Maribacter polysiphoniae]
MTYKTLNTIVVEDSDTQRAVISKLAKEHPQLNVLGDYSNGILALNAIQKNKVDLILLDIEMPVVNGFDLLDSLETPPQIILISNKSDYALKAFEYPNITDYLQKPIEKARFATAIGRVVKTHNQIRKSNKNQDFVYVNVDLQKKKIYLNTIKWIEALGDYIKIVTTEDNYIVLSTMKAFLTQVPGKKLIRIHKSYIVNAKKVDNWSSTKVEVAGTKLPMSRTHKEALEKILITT